MIKDLTSGYKKEMLHLDNKKKNNPMFKMGKGFKYTFLQRMGNST
jgi:hypothetical protein